MVELALYGYEAFLTKLPGTTRKLFKIGIIIDNQAITRWQEDCLRTLKRDNQFVIYNCTNTRPPRRRLGHAFYYLLNLFTIRNRMTRRTALPEQLDIATVRNFEAGGFPPWQDLPEDLLDSIRSDAPSVIVKFGMGLLRVPPPDRLAAPILSYHHGDPVRFRGRPAGFYELLHGERTVGQVIQILGNTLDSGACVAAAETRAIRHSYRATLVESYRHSPLLLKRGIANAIAGAAVQPSARGRNYRLPDNWTVVKFVAARLAALVKHLIYGAFYEKDWNVATAPSRPRSELPIPAPAEPESWGLIARPSGYRFIADPFPHPGGDGVLVEALRASTGLGEILHIGSAGQALVCRDVGHFSYPAPFRFEGADYLLPEVSEWSGPRLYRFDGKSLQPAGELVVAGSPRLIDPTLFGVEDTIYLFANDASEGSSVLRLWTSASLFSKFDEHPASPIRISPSGSRMAGAIVERGPLYRIGQDSRGQYGDGIVLFEIERLTPTEYRETEVGQLRFADCRGPHTLNLAGDRAWFDYYEDRFSLLAGIRRVRSRLVKRPTADRIYTGPNIRSEPRN